MAVPRLLFITNEPPHTAAAGAIVFHRLLRDYPPDRLLVVTNRPIPADAGRLDCRYEQVPLRADRLNRTRFWQWRPVLRSLGGPDLLDLDPLDAALRGFAPDVVVTLMQDSWYYDFAARFARRRGLPLLLFVHDLPHGFEPVPAGLAHLQQARDRAIYRQAAARLCVSEGMVAWFRAHFALSGEVLLPPRDDDGPAQPPRACRHLKQPGHLTLGYAGGLHYGYGEQLLRLLPALRATGTHLEFFGPEPAGVAAGLTAATDVITFHGYAPTPADAWRGLLARCDALLLPYLDPPGAHALQYRTHFPSKLGDCLTLGLPLLATGPADASGVAWCAAHGACALHVPDAQPGSLTAALRRLRDDPDLRERLAASGQAGARHFDTATGRAHFRKILAALPFAPTAVPV